MFRLLLILYLCVALGGCAGLGLQSQVTPETALNLVCRELQVDPDTIRPPQLIVLPDIGAVTTMRALKGGLGGDAEGFYAFRANTVYVAQNRLRPWLLYHEYTHAAAWQSNRLEADLEGQANRVADKLASGGAN